MPSPMIIRMPVNKLLNCLVITGSGERTIDCVLIIAKITSNKNMARKINSDFLESLTKREKISPRMTKSRFTENISEDTFIKSLNGNSVCSLNTILNMRQIMEVEKPTKTLVIRAFENGVLKFSSFIKFNFS